MTRVPPRQHHLDVGVLLDYLEQRAGVAARKAVDEHLGRPCPACRERLRQLGELLELMRLDRSGEVPRALRERALAAFAALERPAEAPGFAERVARLVFDSLAAPLPSPARRAVGEARRMRFALADHQLDLELEREGAATLAMRGHLAAEEPALWTLRVSSAEERFVVRPDAAGAFALAGLPARGLDVALEGPAGRFRLPTIES